MLKEVTRFDNRMIERVSKTMARKAFNNGKYVYFVPQKCGLHGIFTSCINKNDCDETFDSIYNSYAFYNLGGELGQTVKCYAEQ